MSKLKLDLHEIFNNSKEIDTSLKDILNQAHSKHIDEIELIPGKGSGQLKKRVIRFLNDKEIKKMYTRYKVDPINFGRIFVYLKHIK
ncbi:MAG: Smr/MutS family protein [Endomicrobiaceae bacterium]|nr:Smr/MutS family protein [Endomicrobiaceae bacterium]